MPVSAREAALKALGKYRRDGVRTESALDAVLGKESLDARDAALCARIFYGVVQNMALLDFYLNNFSTVKITKMEPQVLDILRLSVYQLVFMTKIPVNAAVSEGVTLAKKHANPRAAGLVNAVLRKIGSNRESLPEPLGGDICEILSVKYSHPLWLVRAYYERLGQEGLEALLKADNADAPVTLMVNTLKADTDSVLGALHNEGVEAGLHPWVKDCIVLSGARGLSQLGVFREGLVYVQDAAAAMAVDAAALKPGMFVIDGCAAPGGKSFAAAIRMRNTGRILSCDLQERKLSSIDEGAARLGLTIISTRAMDAQAPDESLLGQADAVIADVPCSGFGVIRKKPEIRYKREADLEDLPALQLKIAGNLSRYVRPGGILLYATCTLLRRENEDVIGKFLSEHPEFEMEPFELSGLAGRTESGIAAPGFVTLWPHLHGTDGFFICRLRRRV
jgi:16S rRNA (cytosine967-C5)-methyltransferase